MTCSARYLSPSEAAARLRVSPKALRLYEQRGLLTPVRTAAGWRTYGPAEMERAREILALRHLGLSLRQINRVLHGESSDLDHALAVQQKTLEDQARWITAAADKIHTLRKDLAAGRILDAAQLEHLNANSKHKPVTFSLPWPWDSETFELSDIKPLTYIIGPLGSGKTRLAQAIAEALPDAAFIGLDRLARAGPEATPVQDSTQATHLQTVLNWLYDDGATASPALSALISAIVSSDAAVLVVDMVEQGLDQSTQEAVSAYLRHRREDHRPLFLLTRSSSILDLDDAGRDETIILCPANHSPPTFVAPFPGSPGYEAVATCLASPEVRARTEGVIAFRPPAEDHGSGLAAKSPALDVPVQP
tara:strand:+ start:4003 stop:5088 length:1086 start_codon:yes stop_codon:yes gene_type:complete